MKQSGLPALTLQNLLDQPLATLPGLGMHVHWARSRFGPLPQLGALALLAVPAQFFVRRELARAAAILLCAVLFLLALAHGRHTQDFAYRFQAPAGLLCALGAWTLACAIGCDARRALAWRVAALALAVAPWIPAVGRARAQLAWNDRGRTYMDVLPARLDALLGGDARVVLTEAGRLPFWTHARTYDAVGLNDSRCARTPITQAYLREIDPDVVMFHVADALAFRNDEFPEHPNVAPLARESIESHVHPWARELWGKEYERLPEGAVPETYAPLALARFLAENDGYELRVVRYQGAYSHVWAVRRGLRNGDAILEEIARAQDPAGWSSYAALAELPIRPR